MENTRNRQGGNTETAEQVVRRLGNESTTSGAAAHRPISYKVAGIRALAASGQLTQGGHLAAWNAQQDRAAPTATRITVATTDKYPGALILVTTPDHAFAIDGLTATELMRDLAAVLVEAGETGAVRDVADRILAVVTGARPRVL